VRSGVTVTISWASGLTPNATSGAASVQVEVWMRSPRASNRDQLALAPASEAATSVSVRDVAATCGWGPGRTGVRRGGASRTDVIGGTALTTAVEPTVVRTWCPSGLKTSNGANPATLNWATRSPVEPLTGRCGHADRLTVRRPRSPGCPALRWQTGCRGYHRHHRRAPTHPRTSLARGAKQTLSCACVSPVPP
jgi:hypothetical protein